MRWMRWAARTAARVLGTIGTSGDRPSRRGGRTALRPGLEGLERREVQSSLAGGSPAFAEIPGRVATAGRPADVAFRLEPGRFTADRSMPMLLTLRAEPAPGSEVNPQITHVDSLQGRNTYNLGRGRGPLFTNVAVPVGPATVYGVGVRGRGRTTGDFVLKVSLPGDADGDGVVDRTDIGRVRAAYGSTSEGRRYDPGADANGDGKIGVLDYVLAHRNLGARASVVALTPRPGPSAARPARS